ncbi:hypothetical protein, partial [uncultured Dubosiella sp.]|uniref:hypothetical protein n=1 Tax=uncultured Dubosiella sp. TaxID=1937011 RepID=UPI0025B35997
PPKVTPKVRPPKRPQKSRPLNNLDTQYEEKPDFPAFFEKRLPSKTGCDIICLPKIMCLFTGEKIFLMERDFF